MPNRSFTAGNQFRYGFNGKENDNDVKGTGNQQDYGMRIYDTRIGKFLSVDPLAASYPMLTPYQFAGNNPIRFIDLDGAEPAEPSDASVKKLHEHIENMPTPTIVALPQRNTSSDDTKPEYYSTNTMITMRHNDDPNSKFNSSYTISQIDITFTGKYVKAKDGQLLWQETKTMISTEITVPTNFQGDNLSSSQMTQTLTTTYKVSKENTILGPTKGDEVNVAASMVFINCHGKIGSGVGQISPSQEMTNLMEMSRTYVVNNDNQAPTRHIKDSNKNFFGKFFSLYSSVFSKAVPLPKSGKAFAELARIASEHDFGKTLLGATGVFAQRVMTNGVEIRNSGLKSIN